HRLEVLSRGTRELDEFLAESAVTAENALLHPQSLHFPQDLGGLGNVSPENDGINARILDHLQLAAKVGVRPQELLFDYNRMAAAAGSIAELDHAKTAVAVIHPQQSNPFHAEFGVNVARQGIALHPVILNIGEVPGND